MSIIRYQEIDLAESSKWHSYLNRLNESQKDIYFSPDYYRLYEELGDGNAKCFVFEDGKEVGIYPFLLNSINDLGYNLDQNYFDIQGVYGYNGILYSSADEDFITAFHEAFTIYCKDRNIVAEFTRFHPLLMNKDFSQNNMKVIEDRETVFLDLSEDLESIWENHYSSKNRNMIRKACKIGYTIEIITIPSLVDLNRFITIYHRSMINANADAYFYFNEKYFINTFNYLKSYSFLFNVKDIQGEVVCSSIFFKYGENFHYHLSGRSDNADNSVNNFLISEAVKFAKDNNARFIHLGGGRTSSPDDSLLKFKKSFSKKSLLFSIGKKVHNQLIYNIIEDEWNERNPSIKNSHKNFLLKYRI